jgi:hypothetical protein
MRSSAATGRLRSSRCRAVLIGMTIAMPPEFDWWMRSVATIRAASQLAVSAAVHQDDDRMRPEFD